MLNYFHEDSTIITFIALILKICVTLHLHYLGDMKKILKVHNVNDYARYIGAPVMHDLISIIHYDELEHCRHSLNSYDVFGIFIGDEKLEELTYGLKKYDLNRHALMCVAPGQIGGKTDTGEEIQTCGWALLFDPQLLHVNGLDKRMNNYSFFSYYINEALLMTADQRAILVDILEKMRYELINNDPDAHTNRILVSYLELFFEHVARFYNQQLSTETKKGDDILTRFENLMQHYYNDKIYLTHGLPSVKYCAQELCLSPNYFSDVMRQLTGENATMAIRRFVMKRAKDLIMSGNSITEVAYNLGFEYSQHFSRIFKKHFGQTPSQFSKSLNHNH